MTAPTSIPLRKEARIFLVVTLMVAGVSCERSPALYFDANGNPHGTGTHLYTYASGLIKLSEEYKDGQLQRSRWFDPQGKLIQETIWIDGSGEGIYLRDDGSIRSRVTYVAGLAEGPAVYYDTQGTIEKTVQFSKGQPLAKNKP